MAASYISTEWTPARYRRPAFRALREMLNVPISRKQTAINHEPIGSAHSPSRKAGKKPDRRSYFLPVCCPAEAVLLSKGLRDRSRSAANGIQRPVRSRTRARWRVQNRGKPPNRSRFNCSVRVPGTSLWYSNVGPRLIVVELNTDHDIAQSSPHAGIPSENRSSGPLTTSADGGGGWGG